MGTTSKTARVSAKKKATSAKAKKKVSPSAGPQAAAGAWSPEALVSALHRGSDDDKLAIARRAGILDAAGKLTPKYKNWGTKVSRTPDAEELKAERP